jgi:NAD(P)-dependent dehydrogenase (short-subunit alcohol dehydrogenase family)
MSKGSGRLEGRLAVITGASRGIGAAVAQRFAAEGAQLVLIARTVGALEELDDAIRAAGGKQPLLVPHDLRDLDGLDRLGASLNERYGKLDILVGNAGILGPLTPVGHIPPDIWQEVRAGVHEERRSGRGLGSVPIKGIPLYGGM